MLRARLPESWYSWRHVAPRFAAEGYRVILPALRGYERSDKPEDVDAYHPNELGDDLAALLDALGIAQPTAVAGHDQVASPRGTSRCATRAASRASSR
ncbi:MAG: alpha/beta fold hydrolase [Polyangiales bacterium]